MTSPSKNAAGSLGTWLGLKSLDFDKTYKDKFNELVISNGLAAELGRRVAIEKVKKWLVIWETMYKRNALLDSIMVLRACVGVTTDDDELAPLLQTLFLDQRCGLKKTMKPAKDKVSPSNIFKAYILRERVFVHLKKTFPAFGDVVDQYSTVAFYAKEYGVDENGTAIDGHREVPDDDEDQDGASDNDADGEVGITTYQSRRKLIVLCKDLAKHKFERTLISMAGVARATAGGNLLDLTTNTAVVPNKRFRAIQQAYDDVRRRSRHQC